MNIRSKARLTAASLCLAGLIPTGCELIASVDRSEIDKKSASGSNSSSSATASSSGGGMGGTGGTGGAGGAGGQGGAGAGGGCSMESDCPDTMNECVERTCIEGVCGTKDVAKDTPLRSESQTAGDCKTAVCDGGGDITTTADSADFKDDGNDCSADTCSGDIPMHLPEAAGFMCAEGVGKMCDGAGTCVECVDGGDCVSGNCQSNTCVAGSCVDGIKNGSETDKDCGGSCGPCADLQACVDDGDCQSVVCAAGICQAPTCFDGIDNGDETDKDCGGDTCTAKCGPMQGCAIDADCAGDSCNGTTCNATCTDAVMNSNETDVDCGGDTCGDCADNEMCFAASDCQSGICAASVCKEPSCTDGVKNGDETDTDCGGGTCNGCGFNKACVASSDCLGASGSCVGGFCAASCTDTAQNGDETDTDCGGSCPASCALGKGCAAPADCTSDICTANVCSQINGCDATNTTDSTGLPATTIASAGLTYNPKCLRVSVGTDVTVTSNFVPHPLVGGEFVSGMKVQASSGPFVPITNSGNTKTFTMSQAGTFPYYCDNGSHASLGMTGVVFVVP